MLLAQQRNRCCKQTAEVVVRGLKREGWPTSILGLRLKARGLSLTYLPARPLGL